MPNRDRLHSNKMSNIYVSYCQDQIKETVDFILYKPVYVDWSV